MCSHIDSLDRAHAHYSSARGRLLAAITALADSDAWCGDGAADLASWLAARLQIGVRTARELVREADALKSRPALAEALCSGAVSIDQSKALAVLCDEGDEADGAWLENLPYWSYSELEREARKQKARELEHKDGGVYLRMRHTTDERFMKGDFQLYPEDGATLLAALDARIPTGTSLRDWDRANAVALIELAKGGASAREQRPMIVMADGVAQFPSGGVVSGDTAARLACDASIQSAAPAPRLAPAVPAATRRAVEARDGGRCTFPGCERDAFLECHHIVHREHGGSNDMSNLQLVCWTHHKLIHEGEWSLRGEAGPRIAWVRPDGTPFEPRVRIVLDTS